MNLKCEERYNGFADNYEQPPSLWKLIEECVPVSERNEIREILGKTAVDLSLDLHAEVATLLEIWRLMRATSLTLSQSQASHAVLPEAPAIKDLLRQEIQLLLLNIQKKAHKEGRDENDALSSYNPDVVSFALGQNKTGSTLNRPASAESLKDKWMVLRSSQTGRSSENERSILQEESNTLEKHIQFLQECLEEEHKYSLNLMTQSAVPSIAELKEERKILERDLQLPPSIQSLSQIHKPPGYRSSQISCRKTMGWSNTAADPSEGLHSSTLTSELSEADLEQRMKQHNISSVGGSSANGTRDCSIKLGHSGILAESPHRTSFGAVDLSVPTHCGKGASARCLAPKSACSSIPCSKVKSQSKVQPHLMDDVSRTFRISETEPTHDRTCMEESSSLQEDVQKSLVYSESTNSIPIEQQSISSSIHTEAHCTTENKRTLSSRLRSPVEVLSSTSKQGGHSLIPAPPSAEKPIGAQPRSSHRVRRARVNGLAGSA
ncbi:coiled-coil domain-containing protein 24 isoform X2 [Heptranchias perlo]|uniref:coiled-coil domain-containing protein 24 isoform X2 n=1 Tax=Heptranchias perlo TaxID=212740 RepID=UPI0035595E1A